MAMGHAPHVGISYLKHQTCTSATTGQSPAGGVTRPSREAAAVPLKGPDVLIVPSLENCLGPQTVAAVRSGQRGDDCRDHRSCKDDNTSCCSALLGSGDIVARAAGTLGIASTLNTE